MRLAWRTNCENAACVSKRNDSCLYDGVEVELAYRLDVLVDDEVIVELKTVAKLLPIHEAQLLSYLKLSRHRVGLLINFREVHLKDGIKRMVHGL